MQQINISVESKLIKGRSRKQAQMIQMLQEQYDVLQKLNDFCDLNKQAVTKIVKKYNKFIKRFQAEEDKLQDDNHINNHIQQYDLLKDTVNAHFYKKINLDDQREEIYDLFTYHCNMTLPQAKQYLQQHQHSDKSNHYYSYISDILNSISQVIIGMNFIIMLTLFQTLMYGKNYTYDTNQNTIRIVLSLIFIYYTIQFQNYILKHNKININDFLYIKNDNKLMQSVENIIFNISFFVLMILLVLAYDSNNVRDIDINLPFQDQLSQLSVKFHYNIWLLIIQCSLILLVLSTFIYSCIDSNSIIFQIYILMYKILFCFVFNQQLKVQIVTESLESTYIIIYSLMHLITHKQDQYLLVISELIPYIYKFTLLICQSIYLHKHQELSFKITFIQIIKYILMIISAFDRLSRYENTVHIFFIVIRIISLIYKMFLDILQDFNILRLQFNIKHTDYHKISEQQIKASNFSNLQIIIILFIYICIYISQCAFFALKISLYQQYLTYFLVTEIIRRELWIMLKLDNIKYLQDKYQLQTISNYQLNKSNIFFQLNTQQSRKSKSSTKMKSIVDEDVNNIQLQPNFKQV